MRRFGILVLVVMGVALASSQALSAPIFEDHGNGSIGDKWVNDFYSFSYVVDPNDGSNMVIAPQPWWGYQHSIAQFTDTSYTVSWREWMTPGGQGPQVSVTLLNNGYNAYTDNLGRGARYYAGYSFLVYPYNGIVQMITKAVPGVDYNGTTGPPALYENWAGPGMPGQTRGYWMNISASVNVRASSTDLSLSWTGLDYSGNPVTFSSSYSDASADRITSGHGFAFNGYPGDDGLQGVYFDDVVVTSNAVPEPSAILALCSGLVGLAGIARRRK